MALTVEMFDIVDFSSTVSIFSQVSLGLFSQVGRALFRKTEQMLVNS